MASSNSLQAASLSIHLPFGLIGMRQFTRFSLESLPDSPPFQVLRAEGEEMVEFVVIEPGGVVENYVVSLSDEDAEALGVAAAHDALVLNIVTIRSLDPQFVTVNLAGPLVINRRTMVGQQIILAHGERYSTEHVLVDLRSPGGGQP